jgi:hypothetical protein
MCRSAAQLPLRVVTEPLAIPAATVALINKHLVLCYSGQARLARNLLQGVLRRWFGRLPEVCLLTSAAPPPPRPLAVWGEGHWIAHENARLRFPYVLSWVVGSAASGLTHVASSCAARLPGAV